jgi:hypothetical protein
LPNALRHLCIGLCVALLAAMNLHGVTEAQHAVGHAADWPAVALSEVHDGDHHPHVHVAPEEFPDTDPDRDKDGAPPVGHHHHAGDVHAALPSPERSMTGASALMLALRRPGLDPALPGLAGDGPEHPPKRMRTVV